MRQSSFNIVHALAILLLLAVIFVALLPVFETTSRPRTRSWNTTQLRGIHQGLFVYANSNNNWFPGIDSVGQDAGLDVQARLQVLLEGDYFTPEYLISPLENNPAINAWQEGQPFRDRHYSYAMLQVPEEGGRREEWSQTLNSQAIVVSDRNTGSREKPSSIHAEPGDPWMGSVLWNDNHVQFEATDTFETRYGDPPGDEENRLNPADKLFENDGTYDALMLHGGN